MARPGSAGAGRSPLDALDGARLCVALAGGDDPPAPRRRRRRGPRGGSALVATAMLVALVGAAVVERGSSSDDVVLAGNARGEPIEIQVRNRSAGETGLIARGDGYSLRFSNTQQGRGGGLVSGCRAAPGQEACIYGDNLRAGAAFLFRSREGSSAGRFEALGPNAVPFTTNATGLVENLNADKVDGLDATQLQGQRGPEGPRGPDGPEGPPGPTASAAASSVDDVTLDNSHKTVLTTSIELPFAARVMGTASAELDGDGGGNDQAFCYIDGPTADLSQRMTVDLPDAFNSVTTVAVTGAAELPAGTHTITVKCGLNTPVNPVLFTEGNLVVWAIAS